MAQVSFTSEKPSLKIKLLGKRMEFQLGVLTFDDEKDPEMIAEMRKMLEDPNNAGMRQMVRELPTAKAEEISRQFQNAHRSKTTMGVGGFNSESMAKKEGELGSAEAGLRNQLLQAGASEETIQQALTELADGGLHITEKALDKPVERMSDEGFIPNKVPGGEAGQGGAAQQIQGNGTTAAIKMPVQKQPGLPQTFAPRNGK